MSRGSWFWSDSRAPVTLPAPSSFAGASADFFFQNISLESKPPFFPSSAGSGGGGGFHLADTSLCITYSKCRSIIVKTNDWMTAHDSSAMVLAFSVAVPTLPHPVEGRAVEESPGGFAYVRGADHRRIDGSLRGRLGGDVPGGPHDALDPPRRLLRRRPRLGPGGISSCGSEGQITVNAPTDRPNAAASIPPSPNAARSRVSL